MISKELLGKVLGKPVTYIEHKHYNRFLLFYIKESVEDTSPFEIYTTTNIHHRDYGYCKQINIYELAHKCKEWAMNNGYGIGSSTDTNGVIVNGFSGIYKMTAPDDILLEEQADTEPEAIFKACEWILNDRR